MITCCVVHMVKNSYTRSGKGGLWNLFIYLCRLADRKVLSGTARDHISYLTTRSRWRRWLSTSICLVSLVRRSRTSSAGSLPHIKLALINAQMTQWNNENTGGIYRPFRSIPPPNLERYKCRHCLPKPYLVGYDLGEGVDAPEDGGVPLHVDVAQHSSPLPAVHKSNHY